MKKILLICVFSQLIAGVVFATEVNVIMKDGTFVKGDLLGITTNELYLQDTNGKANTIKIDDVKSVFDSASGNPVNLSPVNQMIIYRPEPIVVEGPKNAIGLDVVGLFLNYYQLSYEHAVNGWFALKADATYSPNYAWNSGVGLWKAAVNTRFYLGHAIPWFGYWYNGLSGFYLETGVGVEGGWINYSYSDYYGSYQVSGIFPAAPMIHLGFGNKMLFGTDSGVYLEPYFGFEIPFGSWNYSYSGSGAYSSSSSQAIPYGVGNLFIFGIGLGYAF